MRLGYFPKFKSGDAVLIACDLSDIGKLRQLTGEALHSDVAVAIHAHCVVSEHHPAQLFAAGPAVPVPSGDFIFTWRINPSTYPNVDGLLEGVALGRGGHQYFDLERTPAFLMISVGEYEDAWWARHA